LTQATPAIDGATFLAKSLYPYHGSSSIPIHKRIATPLPQLNSLLDGGFELGEIIELAGPPKSGKTMLVLHTILRALLLNDELSVLYIDTRNSFSAFVCLDILEVLIRNLAKEGIVFYMDDDNDENREGKGKENRSIQEWKVTAVAALDRLNVTKCFDAIMAISAIDQSLADSVSKNETNLSIIVIDSVTTLLGGQIMISNPLQGAFPFVNSEKYGTNNIGRDRSNQLG
jgi:RecA/RadA recombinase